MFSKADATKDENKNFEVSRTKRTKATTQSRRKTEVDVYTVLCVRKNRLHTIIQGVSKACKFLSVSILNVVITGCVLHSLKMTALLTVLIGKHRTIMNTVSLMQDIDIQSHAPSIHILNFKLITLYD